VYMEHIQQSAYWLHEKVMQKVESSVITTTTTAEEK